MYPILFKIGSLIFPSYHILIMVGVLASVFFGVHFCKAQKLPIVYAFDLGIVGILFGFLGGRLAHVLIEAPQYYLEDPFRVFYIWQGGFVSFGAHIGVLLSFYLYLKYRKQPVWAYFDLAAPCFAIALFFGRMGCLLEGCCFGKPTSFPLHLIFTNPASTAYYFYPKIALHATQIYLMLNALILFSVLFWIYKKHYHFQGQLISICLGLYSVGRFFIEFLRGDVDRGVYFNGAISSAQISMIFYFIVSGVLFFYFKKKALPTMLL